MPRIGETGYVFHAPNDRVLERGRAQEVRQPVELGGDVVAPTAGTYRLYDISGDLLLEDSATVGSDKVIAYTIGASDLPATLAFGSGYTEEWELTMPDGSTRKPRRLVIVARKALDMPVGDSDMDNEYVGLSGIRGASLSTYQAAREQAWGKILRRLTREGAWSHLAYGSAEFYDVALALSLAKLFRGLYARTGDVRWLNEARDQEAAYEREWKRLAVVWDRDEDGVPDNPEEREGVGGPIHRNAAVRGGPCLSPRF
jgi:hypothetical protein